MKIVIAILIGFAIFALLILFAAKYAYMVYIEDKYKSNYKKHLNNGISKDSDGIQKR